MRKHLFTLFVLVFAGCANTCTKSFGGAMTVELPNCQKLEMATWKDDDLWYQTRQMNEGDKPITHTFKEKSAMGVAEGTVTIVEKCVK
jgi:hypothetical protein